MMSLLSRDEWSVGDEREVDSGVWDEVGLKLDTLRELSKWREAMMEETSWPIRRLRLV